MRKLFYLTLVVCAFYGTGLQAQVRVLTSYADSAGHPNLTYEDNNAQHIHLLSFNGTSWADQDLSNITGVQNLPMADSPLTSVHVSDGTNRIFYVCSTSCPVGKAPNEVCELLESGGAWSVSCGTALAEAAEVIVQQPPAVSSQLTSYDNSSCGGGVHVIYQESGTDFPLHQLYYHGGSWVDNNISDLAGGAAPVLGTPLGSYVRTDTCGDHVAYLGVTNQVNEIYEYNGWHYQGLGGQAVFVNNVANLSAFADCHGEHIIYEDVNSGDVIQWYYNFSSWSQQNFGVRALGGAGITSFGDSGCVEHIFYPDQVTVDVHQHYYNGSWHDQDLTALTGGAPSSVADLTGFASGSNQYLFYLDNSGFLDQLHYNGSSWSWFRIEGPQ